MVFDTTEPSSFSYCVNCPVGHFNNIEGKEVCTTCPIGTFNPNEGSSSSSNCLKCSKGH